MDNGWISYENRRPPIGILCQFGRCTDRNHFPQVANRWVGFDDFHPPFNVANLYWRLTGIGREKLESMSPEARLQAESSSYRSQFLNALMAQGQANYNQQLGAYSFASGLGNFL